MSAESPASAKFLFAHRQHSQPVAFVVTTECKGPGKAPDRIAGKVEWCPVVSEGRTL
jgi:hypothetical protein